MIKSINLYLQFQKELSTLEIVGEAYNKLDYTLIEGIAAEDIQYSSFWVYEILKGQSVIDYLNVKFNNLLQSSTRVYLEIAYLQDEKPVLIISEGDKLKKDGILLISLNDDGKLDSIEITNPMLFSGRIRYTGFYPGQEL